LMPIAGNKGIYIVSIDKHLFPNLNVRQSAVPDLRPPKPFGCTDMGDQLFNRVESFSWHCMGVVCSHFSSFEFV